MNYEIGDRVRFFTSDYPCTAEPERTGYREPVILENGKEGTIVSFNSFGNPIVKWDATTYRIYQAMEITPTGMKFLDKGTTELGAFECGIHTDHIEPISPDAANRPTTPAAKEREAQQRQYEKFQSMVSYMIIVMVVVDHSNRFDARERNRMAEIIVEHFNKSDQEIADLLRASGFDLGGMMSAPAKQVADIKLSCQKKYSETLGSSPAHAPSTSPQPQSSQPQTNADKPWWRVW